MKKTYRGMQIEVRTEDGGFDYTITIPESGLKADRKLHSVGYSNEQWAYREAKRRVDQELAA